MSDEGETMTAEEKNGSVEPAAGGMAASANATVPSAGPLADNRAPSKWRKKPIEVEAIRYDGPACVECRGSDYPRQAPEFDGVRRFVGSAFSTLHAGSRTHGGPEQYAPAIRTREGTMRVSPGDWVVRGAVGEFYPCKPDAFAATFEPLGLDGDG